MSDAIFTPEQVDFIERVIAPAARKLVLTTGIEPHDAILQATRDAAAAYERVLRDATLREGIARAVWTTIRTTDTIAEATR